MGCVCGAARIEDPEIKSLDGQPVNQLLRGRRYVYSYRVRFLKARPSFSA